MFTLHIANRDYTEWVCENTKKETLDISPLTKKLFHGDHVDANGILMRASPYRTKEAICGVLLTSQKTYGRKGSKLLYKCVPDDEHLPCFLVPYEEKTIGFDKNKSDHYITFKIKEWTTKHPIGLLTNTFGKVDDMEAYVAYQMGCKDIGDSLKTFNAASLRVLREYTLDPLPVCYKNGKYIEDRRHLSIISIDPIGCMDIDDAIGIRTIPNGDTVLSIYIANVPLLLEYLQMWTYITDRVSTIYLPTKKYPMLPVSLSENMCSLKEKEDRIAFVMDIKMANPWSTPEISYTSAIICVEKNYAYGAPELVAREDYKSIFKTVQQLNNQHSYVSHMLSSHDVVEYCMLLMNHECAKILKIKKRGGIFRSATKKEEIKETVAPGLKSILQNVAGEYSSEAKPHELLGLDLYTHITSPIRRIVDIVNMMNLIEEHWSANAIAFMEKWQEQSHLDHINAKTKAIRRLQNEMELMTLYEKNPGCIYNGVVFQRSEEAKGLYKYRAYIPETKMLTSVLSANVYKNYAEVNFSAHLFLDEAKMTKKIRLQIL